MTPFGYSIAIPAYGRPSEFEELLISIIQLNKNPDEIIICEDCSPERHLIKHIAIKWEPLFQKANIKFVYIENEKNLGYDGNIRKLIQTASFKWVILIGNDDIFLPDGLSILNEFCIKNEDIAMVSRPFVRFRKSINEPIGISKFFPCEKIITKKDPANLLFRTCGFVGGLVINKNWAANLHTNKYDGSLYYQIYLACHAYCTSGIGYLSSPTVGGRVGNPPLFGESGMEDHIPGAYSAKARAKMWKSVLEIGRDVGSQYNINLYDSLKNELRVQQAFHVFEMNATASRRTLNDLKKELKKIGLFKHVVPMFLYSINYLFGKKSSYFYYIVRKYKQ